MAYIKVKTMKHYHFLTKKDFENAVSIAYEWSNGRHYCVDEKNKTLSIAIIKDIKK